MARQKTEAIVKVKAAIMELSDDDAELTAEWLDMLIDVREQERERQERKAVEK